MRSAYLHVLADTLTPVLAIIALLAGRYMGWIWMDPAMGLVGAALITRWGMGSRKGDEPRTARLPGARSSRRAVKQALERGDSDVVTDLHLWAIGPGIYALAAAIVTHTPRPVESYRERLPKSLAIVHTRLEIHHCDGVSGRR